MKTRSTEADPDGDTMRPEGSQRESRTITCEGQAPGPVPAVGVKVIPAAALALLGELYGLAAICVGCTRTVGPGKACAACGTRATVTAAPPDGAAPPPGSPCRHCRKLTPRRTRGLCPRCHTRASRAEDYLFLTAAGVHPDQAAARVGVSRRTIERDLAGLARIRNPARCPPPSGSSPVTARSSR
jgi:RNA polymerase subunit RPABC4/transcription elongation factor Spt4